jgi:hypothetical protein
MDCYAELATLGTRIEVGTKVVFLDRNMVVVNIEGTMLGNRRIELVDVKTGELSQTYA